jgi:hypothetical protein
MASCGQDPGLWHHYDQAGLGARIALKAGENVGVFTILGNGRRSTSLKPVMLIGIALIALGVIVLPTMGLLSSTLFPETNSKSEQEPTDPRFQISQEG